MVTSTSSNLWFEDSVPDSDRSQIETGLAVIQSYLASTFSTSPAADACLDVRAPTEGPVGVGRASAGFILIVTAPAGWPITTDWALARVAAHECVHVWQIAIAGEESFATSAVWLLEGMAEWLSSQSLIDAGLGSADEYNPLLDEELQPLTPHLSMMETPQGWSTSPLNYWVSFQALSFLMSTGDPSQLMTYLVELGRGQPWQTAFLDAFGLAVDDFYRLFDERLQTPEVQGQRPDSPWLAYLLQEDGWRHLIRDQERPGVR